MILYRSDWDRYPSAIIHYSTKNTTWLRQAEVYKKMGISNCEFLLALIQPELEGVDPFSTNLDLETKAKIGLECQNNPWYYFREIMRVPAQGGRFPRMMEANRGNIALWWLFFNSVDTGLTQPRQTGKSLTVDGLVINLNYISLMNSRINMITKDDALRRANVDRLKGIRSLLPPYLVAITRDDSDNMFELTCNIKNNKYNTGVAQNSETAANNLGRGLTSPVQLIDEGPFISYIGTTIPAALAAGTAAKEEATAAGLPNANLFTTTAGKKDDRDGKFMYEMFHEAAPWSEVFYDARDRTDLMEMIKKNKTGRKYMVNITMSHRQLGKSDQWLYDAIANTKSSGEAADRDFFNIWTSGSQRSPLTVALNEQIRRSLTDVVWTEMSPERYSIRWYHEAGELAMMNPTVQFIIGLDTSNAVGRDAIGMVITNSYDLSTVGAGSYNETNLMRFAEYLAYVMIRYTNTTLVIENRSSGQGIIDLLIIYLARAGIDPFKRIYNKIVDEHRTKPEAFKEITGPVEYRDESFYDRRKKYFGVVTDNTIRDQLFTTVLQNAAKKAGKVVKDLTLINEITGLVEKNGRIDHASSGHDDHVIAWLLTHYFLFHCHNLAYYGIDSSSVGIGADNSAAEMTDNELAARSYQENLVRELELTIEELKATRDPFTVAKLESKMITINKRLVFLDVSSPSIDALILATREQRDLKNTTTGNMYKPMEYEINLDGILSRR